jgi:serine/threonine protein kinase
MERIISGGHKGIIYSSTGINHREQTKPQNPLTGIQKLVVALEMAKGLADLNGHSFGVLVHDDLSPSQYLLSADKSAIKINDFNRAEIPLWDESNQEYCTYTNGGGYGRVRTCIPYCILFQGNAATSAYFDY